MKKLTSNNFTILKPMRSITIRILFPKSQAFYFNHSKTNILKLVNLKKLHGPVFYFENSWFTTD